MYAFTFMFRQHVNIERINSFYPVLPFKKDHISINFMNIFFGSAFHIYKYKK